MFFDKVFRKKWPIATLLTLSCLLAVVISSKIAHSTPDILNAEERTWLTQHPDIRVAFSADYPPFSLEDKDGQYTGLADDYFDLIEQRLSLKFNRLSPTKAQSAAINPADKQVDVVSLFAFSDARNQRWLYTKPYVDLPLYIIGNAADDTPEEVTLKNLGEYHLTLVKHSAAHDYVKQYYPNIPLELVEDTCEGVRHAAFEAHDVLVADLTAVSWCMRSQGLMDLKVIGKIEFNHTLGIAVRKDWPILQSIMNKGLASITPDEREEIYQRWAGKNLLEEDKLKNIKLWLVFVALFCLGIMLVRLYMWDRSLQERILNRFPDADAFTLEEPASALSDGFKHKLLIPSIVAFIIALMFAIAFILYGHLYKHMWTGESGHTALTLIVSTLTLFCLAGGYKLGGLRRGKEIEDLFYKLIVQSNLRQKSEQLLSKNEESLRNQNEVLMTLASTQLIDRVNKQQIFHEITALSANALEVEQVSFWLISDDGQQLNCVDMFQRSLNKHSSGQVLRQVDYPNYFQALQTQHVFAVTDVMTDPNTKELVESYVQNFGIGALLEGPILLNNKVVGVICHEHVGGPREWSVAEQNFVRSISDIAKLAIEIDHRKAAEEALLKHQNDLENTIKLRTAALEHSSKLSRFLFERAPVAIAYMNVNNEIIDMNAESEKLTGYSRAQVIGKTFRELFSIDETIGQLEALAERVAQGAKIQGEVVQAHRADGSRLEVAIWRSMEVDDEGNPIIITIAQDVSKQRAIEAALISARESAEAADRIKSMFVASMSHELRTPLNSIIGFLGVVVQGMSGDLNSKQQDQLGRAYQSSKHLLALISDVIDVSKIEAGFLETQLEKFELKPLLLEAEQMASHLSNGKKIAVSIECADDIWLETDRKRLFQAILNVLSNALKYTEEGTVKLKAELLKKQLDITVQDTGIGIAEANFASIFKPFERADSRLKIKTPGTGLGLYLTHKILTQLLGGSIEVASELEVGTTFTIKVPLKAPKSKPDQTLEAM